MGRGRVARRCAAVTLGVLLALGGTASCGTVVTDSGPLVRRLAAAPVPDGAVAITSAHADGNFEIGPRASLEYSWQVPYTSACTELLRLYDGKGYTLDDYSERPAPIGDIGSWCAAQTGLQPTAAALANIVVIVYPAGVHTGHPSDGFTAVLTPGRSSDVHPDGTHLELSA